MAGSLPLGTAPAAGSRVRSSTSCGGVHIAAAAEACPGLREGVAADALYEVITHSAGNSWMFENRMAHVLAGDYRPLSAVDIFVKDLGLVRTTARTAMAARTTAPSSRSSRHHAAATRHARPHAPAAGLHSPDSRAHRPANRPVAPACAWCRASACPTARPRTVWTPSWSRSSRAPAPARSHCPVACGAAVAAGPARWPCAADLVSSKLAPPSDSRRAANIVPSTRRR
ncbi:hypothetical protein FQR65_LT20820 [Abscondita terminalis]|nr:hypothetical protein FQR65_LT20820 [Abscondita terminalis]